MTKYLYSELSSLVQARLNCLTKPDTREWIDKHESMIEELVKSYMPSGSGYDSGTTLVLNESKGEKLVFSTAFHHMDDNGYYDGWTEHTVTVKPSLSHGFDLYITGPNRNDIKDLIGEQFDEALRTNVEWDIMQQWPIVKALNLSIEYKWVDQCTGEHVVKHNGEIVYNGTQAAKAMKTYADSLELCRSFCVSYARKLTGGVV